MVLRHFDWLFLFFMLSEWFCWLILPCFLVFWLFSAVQARAVPYRPKPESYPNAVGDKRDEKSLGKRSALNSHAGFDEAGAGNTIGRLVRQHSTLPVGR
ncbi:hypothetical protein ADIS_0273 [Lunatimonas lonarensis]|uniref:Uncharacterized protein n=1 Tax=Lunatimonas lonarensis TaxID=1232681 RepID=R7ZYZ4_9BACT|nr:hypothetical protein ADIS_0273 [Lunatimonas lonarensis]